MLKRSRRDDERGATAVVVALMATVLFTAAALAVDISNLAMERQNLHDHIDSAAHAGAFELPDNPAAAVAAARQIARAQDSAIDPETELFCVVASEGTSHTVKASQIPGTCNPGSPPYTASSYPGLRCNQTICAIPCRAGGDRKCNTMRVWDNKLVDYKFAPVFGQETGDTGAVSSAACKGSCGNETPNPMDVVVVADRSPSMNEHLGDLREAILDSLTTMSPQLHYVAFGALHKSSGTGTCRSSTQPWNGSLGSNATTRWQANIAAGTWVPAPFSNNYLNADGNLNYGSTLVNTINCMPNGQVSGYSGGNYGTHLSGALKGAGRYVLGLDANNLGSLPARPVDTEAKKVILFETDGAPDELYLGGSTSVGVAGDVGAGPQQTYSGMPSGFRTDSNRGQIACDQLRRVATDLKSRDVLLITIGFGNAGTANCNRNGTGEKVRDVLADVASPNADGTDATASNCSYASQREAENSDGDYFFCAAAGSELKDIFKTALAQVGDGIRLIRLP